MTIISNNLLGNPLAENSFLDLLTVAAVGVCDPLEKWASKANLLPMTVRPHPWT